MLLRNGEKRMRSGRWAAGIGITAAVFGTLSLVSWSTARATGPFTLGTAVALPSSDGGTEPRYTVTPDDKHYAISNSGGTARVWESDDGLTGWQLTAGTPANQTSLSTIDVDIASMPTGSAHPGRLIAAELDE